MRGNTEFWNPRDHFASFLRSKRWGDPPVSRLHTQ